MRDLVARELFDGVLTYHSYSQLILYPWGYTSEPIAGRRRPGASCGLAADDAGADPGSARRDLHAQQSSQLYPTAGDTTDWTYGEYGIPVVHDRAAAALFAEGGFILPASQIQPCWEENRPAALEFVRHVFERPES